MVITLKQKLIICFASSYQQKKILIRQILRTLKIFLLITKFKIRQKHELGKVDSSRYPVVGWRKLLLKMKQK